MLHPMGALGASSRLEVAQFGGETVILGTAGLSL
jgi:hypothetical protein